MEDTNIKIKLSKEDLEIINKMKNNNKGKGFSLSKEIIVDNFLIGNLSIFRKAILTEGNIINKDYFEFKIELGVNPKDFNIKIINTCKYIIRPQEIEHIIFQPHTFINAIDGSRIIITIN